MNPALAVILKDTYSTSMLRHRLRILKENLVQKYFGEKAIPNGQEDVNTSLVPEDEAWLKSLQESFLKQFNKDNVYASLDGLEKSSQEVPILTLYLTFEPDESTLAQIGSKVRNLFGSNILLDIKLDLSLVAGCALGWKGVMRDYSLKSQIEAKKSEILDAFKRFLRTTEPSETKI